MNVQSLRMHFSNNGNNTDNYSNNNGANKSPTSHVVRTQIPISSSRLSNRSSNDNLVNGNTTNTMTSSTTVSYTHLDVYKRQPQYCGH